MRSTAIEIEFVVLVKIVEIQKLSEVQTRRAAAAVRRMVWESMKAINCQLQNIIGEGFIFFLLKFIQIFYKVLERVEKESVGSVKGI